MAINMMIQNPTFGFPMMHHALHSYTVNKEDGVVVANVNSYFNAETATSGYQASMKTAIQIVGAPDVDVEAWIYTQLVLPQSEDVQTVPIMNRDKYPWASGFTPRDRFFFAGGTVTE